MPHIAQCYIKYVTLLYIQHNVTFNMSQYHIQHNGILNTSQCHIKHNVALNTSQCHIKQKFYIQHIAWSHKA